MPEYNKLAFNILDLDGDQEISILDLVWACSNFSEETRLGKAVLKLFEFYMDKNVRPKYVKAKYYLNFQAYNAELPVYASMIKDALIEDLKYAFKDRLIKIQEKKAK